MYQCTRILSLLLIDTKQSPTLLQPFLALSTSNLIYRCLALLENSDVSNATRYGLAVQIVSTMLSIWSYLIVVPAVAATLLQSHHSLKSIDGKPESKYESPSSTPSSLYTLLILYLVQLRKENGNTKKEVPLFHGHTYVSIRFDV